MARFRSLRWRLTAFYLGLLAVLLLVGGFAQYFAAREVLFRTNAQVLTSEYAPVLTAFRKQNVNRPATALRALILSNQFSSQLPSRHPSAAIFDGNGGRRLPPGAPRSLAAESADWRPGAAPAGASVCDCRGPGGGRLQAAGCRSQHQRRDR